MNDGAIADPGFGGATVAVGGGGNPVAEVAWQVMVVMAALESRRWAANRLSSQDRVVLAK